MNNLSQIYKKNSVESLSPGAIILLLFDTVLQSLGKAKFAMGQPFSVKNQELLHNNLQKAERILQELQGCLNFKPAKQLAETLYRLYDYAQTQINLARREKKVENIENAEKVLKELKEGWNEMLLLRNSTPNK